jgi:hypothetical protein
MLSVVFSLYWGATSGLESEITFHIQKADASPPILITSCLLYMKGNL